ncbi:MAG: type II toxin-antitoxin system PemK/MazF family toxin [Candidatus Melainabacteria bacterium]|nr:type II toxin-antitoxin system PemK/MazF family toxin [Candidatus Melainabacteria bacterium]
MVVVKRPERFDVFLVALDPTMGAEIQKSRPCVVISPNEINRYIQTVIIAPMTTADRSYPSRVPVQFGGKNGQIVLDQIRAVDRSRLVKHLGVIDAPTADTVLDVLVEMFSP